MGYAKSGGEIYSRRKWQRRMEERRGDVCGHVFKPCEGYMICVKCGYSRLPVDGEDAGDLSDLPIARAGGQGIEVAKELNIRADGREGDM